MMASYRRDLPHELTDLIVDCLRDDKDALKACGLASRCFLRRAQYHLFGDLDISSNSWEAFERLCGSAPHVPSVVRSLRIAHCGNFKDDTLARLHAGFAGAICGFTSVTKLELHYVALTDALVDVLVANFPAIKELRVVRCVVTSLGGLQKMATSYSHLEKLKMDNINLLNDSGGFIPPTRPLITSVRIPSRFVNRDILTTGFLEWMAKHSLHTHVDTLEIPIFHPQEAISVDAFLRERGSALRHLCLHVDADTPDAGLLLDAPLSLAPCSNLRTLSFFSLKLHCADRRDASRRLSCLPALLQDVHAPSLQQVHFRIHAGGATPQDLVAIDWARIDEILSQRGFDSLRRVTVEILRGEALQRQVIPYIRSQLPLLDERRIGRYIHRLRV